MSPHACILKRLVFVHLGLSGHRDEITLARELVRRVKNADELFKKVVAPREAVIDSEHLKLLSEIAREQAQSARGELVTFDTVEYSEKLVSVRGCDFSLELWRALYL